MQDYLQIFLDGYYGYWNYLSSEILYPSWHNYFWWLLGISVGVWCLELVFPWRKNQAAIREDFWLDGFYMFFNFFLFSLIGYNAVSNVAVEAFTDFLALFGIENLVAIQVASWPTWSQFLLLFVVADFIQWNVHRWLHHSPWLWEFHKVHHSVEEMGFAAHLRYHWMENILYKPLKTLAVMLLGGFEPEQAYIVHFVAITIGHLNHANLGLTYGPFKYLLNNPVMHLYHHAKVLPDTHKYGVNFGISLSVWDYLFRSSFVPRKEAHLELGYQGDEQMPKGFIAQHLYGFRKAQ